MRGEAAWELEGRNEGGQTDKGKMGDDRLKEGRG